MRFQNSYRLFVAALCVIGTFVARAHTKRPRVVCWILRRAGFRDDLEVSEAISRGWGRGCDSLTFIDKSTPGIATDWNEGYLNLSSKSYEAWHFLFREHKNADFFLKADLDTFVFHQRLRAYLSRFDPNEAHYIGRQFVNKRKVNFVAGAAIILSRAAIEQFTSVEKRHALCEKETFVKEPAEDLALGACLNAIGIFPHNTRDRRGRERFMVFNPQFLQNGLFPDWYMNFSFNKASGAECCSRNTLVLHQMYPSEQKVQLKTFSRMLSSRH